jgi:hypothetical protein
MGVNVTPRRWPFEATDARGVRGGGAASFTRPAWALPARRIRCPFTPRMFSACAGECCKFDSIGVALQVRLDRRGRHRRAASVALSRHGCAGRARGRRYMRRCAALERRAREADGITSEDATGPSGLSHGRGI